MRVDADDLQAPTRNVMSAICDRIDRVRARIAAAEQRYGRSPGSVALLAVSKAKGEDLIREALGCGQRLFGESYVQEAMSKLEALGATDMAWHFIGAVQANKTRYIAEHFAWVHSVDRLKSATRLSAQRPPALGALNICLQLDVGGETSKRGLTAAELPRLARQVNELPWLRLRGLMAIPPASADFEQQRQHFAAVRAAYEELRASGYRLDTLSMGMSNDLEAAIAEGTTIVRIGTAIFGPRP